VRGEVFKSWLTAAAVFLLTQALLAQVQVGDDLSFKLHGDLSTNYSGTYGNEIDSSHGLGLGGAAGLSGYYYSPNFVSFSVDPFINQSRSNANTASVTDASGVSLSTSIFNGSHFPGSINFSKAYDSTGNYGMPGISAFDTNSNSQDFGINWSVLFPHRPTLNVNYQRGHNDYSLYGTNEDGNSKFQSLTFNSNYTLAGFGLGGGVSFGNSSSLIPQVLVGENETESNASNKNYNVSASHPLPWNGSFSTNFNHSNTNSDYLGYRFDGAVNRWMASAGMHPTRKLAFSFSTDYTSDTSGSLYQMIIPGAQGGTDSSKWSQSSTEASGQNFLFTSTYTVANNLITQASMERRLQSYGGADYGSTLFSAGASYTHEIAGGYVGTTFNLVDSKTDNSDQSSLGFTSNTNFNRRVGAWQMGAYFNYTQNVQTFLVSYTTSFYSLSANVGRRVGPLHWSVNGSMGRSGLTAQPGTNSHSESAGSSIGTRHINFTGNYSQSDGTSLPGGGGLIQQQLPPGVPGNLLVMYGGESYAFGLSSSPVRRLTASATYSKSRITLNNQGLRSWNNYEQENFYFQYHFRQVNLTGGYTRLVQGFSASPLPPANLNSFSIGLSRWFDFF
jgi:hypothetical protein